MLHGNLLNMKMMKKCQNVKILKSVYKIVQTSRRIVTICLHSCLCHINLNLKYVKPFEHLPGGECTRFISN